MRYIRCTTRTPNLLGRRVGFCTDSQWKASDALHAMVVSFLLGDMRYIKGEFSSGRREDYTRGFLLGDLQSGDLRASLRTKMWPRGSPDTWRQ